MTDAAASGGERRKPVDCPQVVSSDPHTPNVIYPEPHASTNSDKSFDIPIAQEENAVATATAEAAAASAEIGSLDQNNPDDGDDDEAIRDMEKRKESETATDATAESEKPEEEDQKIESSHDTTSGHIIVSSSKKSRPPYKYDPNKITLRFLFANRDGLTVTVQCNPTDTIGEVKGALLSVWPEGMPECSGGDRLRLICMGKGCLTPDTRTLEDCQLPVFKTHPTPINVSVKPGDVSRPHKHHSETKKKGDAHHNTTSSSSNATHTATAAAAVETGQGCGCVIQ